MKVGFLVSEVVPFSKTGGLADVAGALPPALARLGADIFVVTPAYRGVLDSIEKPICLGIPFSIPVGDRLVTGRVHVSHLPGSTVKVYLVEQPEYFDREGLYGDDAGPHPDNAERFIFFSRVALELMERFEGAPDVVHVHDWHTGLVPLYLKTLYRDRFPGVRSVFTIHNLAYQGLFPASDMAVTGLPGNHFNFRELEFFGDLCFLKGGIVHADVVATVSPTYAREIQTSDFGGGLEGVLRERSLSGKLYGILNGADYNVWDPAEDPLISRRYDDEHPAGKGACKAALQRKLGLPVRKRVPLAGVISRLAEQKGIDLIVDMMKALPDETFQLAVLGSGEERYEEMMRELTVRFPGRVAVQIGFDERLAHGIEAGADLFLMPSRFEPCGLNQMYSLKYGTIPVVRATGGLRDTVEDGVTGFVFSGATGEALAKAMKRALEIVRDPVRREVMMQEMMARDYSWDQSAREYLALYQGLI